MQLSATIYFGLKFTFYKCHWRVIFNCYYVHLFYFLYFVINYNLYVLLYIYLYMRYNNNNNSTIMICTSGHGSRSRSALQEVHWPAVRVFCGDSGGRGTGHCFGYHLSSLTAHLLHALCTANCTGSTSKWAYSHYDYTYTITSTERRKLKRNCTLWLSFTEIVHYGGTACKCSLATD